MKKFSLRPVIIVLVSMALGALLFYGLLQTGFGKQLFNIPDYTFSGPDQTAYVAGYNEAPKSLAETLMTDYYPSAKENCIKENQDLGGIARLEDVITISKIVRDEFAQVGFCGSGANSIFANIDGKWKKVFTVADWPACTAVDKYKVSKEVVESCFSDDGTIVAVTYN
jgi:hypothetical protein